MDSAAHRHQGSPPHTVVGAHAEAEPARGELQRGLRHHAVAVGRQRRGADDRRERRDLTRPAHREGEVDRPNLALDAALRKALRPFYPWIEAVRLEDYKVRIIDGSRGTAARTRVLIVSSDGRTKWGTVGVSDNIIEASWLALVDSYEFHALRAATA